MFLTTLVNREAPGEGCPANRQSGKEGMKPTAEGVAEYLSKHA